MTAGTPWLARLLFAGLGMGGTLLGADVQPVLIGTYDSGATCLASYGPYVVGGRSAGGLRVVDLSDPRRPKPAGECATAGGITDLAVSGHFAYATEGTNGLEVFDLANPAQPQRVGGFETAGRANAVALTGRHACVAVDGEGLVILEVSNPAVPAPVGVAQIAAGYDSHLAVADDRVVMTSTDNGVMIFDISDAANPRLLGMHPTRGGVLLSAVAIIGDYLYLGSIGGPNAGSLDVWNVSDPGQWVYCSGFFTREKPRGIQVSGHYAYVTTWAVLFVFDVSDPAHPQQVSHAPGGWDLEILGRYAYDGAIVYDLDHTVNPRLVGKQPAGGFVWDVAVAGHHAWLAMGLMGLAVMDVSDPTRPELVGMHATPGAAASVVVSGDHAYVAEGAYGVEIFSVANPTPPQRVGGYGVSAWSSITVLGDNLLVAGGNHDLEVINVSDPTNPRQIGLADHQEYPWGIAGAGDHVYLAMDDYGVNVVDVSDPSQPQLENQEMASEDYRVSRGVAVSGRYLFVAKQVTDPEEVHDAEVAILDLVDPAYPRHLGNYSCHNAVDVAGMGHYLLVLSPETGLDVVDVNETLPHASCRVGGYSDLPGASSLTVAGGRIYVAGSEGLAILEMGPYFKSMTSGNGQLRLSWENFGSAVLQKTASLNDPDWQLVPGSSSTNQMTVPISGVSSEFFRVARP